MNCAKALWSMKRPFRSRWRTPPGGRWERRKPPRAVWRNLCVRHGVCKRARARKMARVAVFQRKLAGRCRNRRKFPPLRTRRGRFGHWTGQNASAAPRRGGQKSLDSSKPWVRYASARRWRKAKSINPWVELSFSSALAFPLTMGPSAVASSLPSSTPHWSNELIPKITPSTKTRCS